MTRSRVLVVGATGLLGGVIARKLIRSGVGVRALARNREALAPLATDAEIAALDLRDVPTAHAGVSRRRSDHRDGQQQHGAWTDEPVPASIWPRTRISAPPRATPASAAWFMSRTAASPRTHGSTSSESSGTSRTRSGGAACRTSCSVRPRSWTSGSINCWPRTFARRVLRRSSATATTSRELHRRGRRRRVRREDSRARDRQRGRRSRRALDCHPELLGIARRAPSGSSGKRRHVPVAAMRLLPPVVRPFNEVAARLITLGLHAAIEPLAFPEWQASADRFGVAPRTVETYVDQMPR